MPRKTVFLLRRGPGPFGMMTYASILQRIPACWTHVSITPLTALATTLCGQHHPHHQPTPTLPMSLSPTLPMSPLDLTSPPLLTSSPLNGLWPPKWQLTLQPSTALTQPTLLATAQKDTWEKSASIVSIVAMIDFTLIFQCYLTVKSPLKNRQIKM